jgi:hypothetical protein
VKLQEAIDLNIIRSLKAFSSHRSWCRLHSLHSDAITLFSYSWRRQGFASNTKSWDKVFTSSSSSVFLFFLAISDSTMHLFQPRKIYDTKRNVLLFIQRHSKTTELFFCVNGESKTT